AGELLIEKGYDALTIQDITERADLARGTFYIHFKDKEEAIWSILRDSFSELDNVLYAGDSNDPAAFRYRKWVVFFEYVAQHRELLSVLIGERGHITLYRRTTDYMAHIIQRDMENGTIERITQQPVPFVAQFMAGAMMQVIVWWLQQPPGELSSEEMSRRVFELILREPPSL
ncbi:MAG: TetR/AcrR family transcriptional regulator, partial [Chloroflexota bacterium]